MSNFKATNGNHLNIVGKKYYVKFMVSLRCKKIAEAELKKLGIKYSFSVHGGIEFLEEVTRDEFEKLKRNLRKSGLVLLDENNSLLIDKIINTIIEVVHYSEKVPNINYAEIISDNFTNGNESILKIFSDIKGISVMQFIIVQKIERIKELLLYHDLDLSEIAEMLNYKNEDYLVAQFKKYTGLSPVYFKKLKKKRKNITKGDRPSVHSETSNQANGTNS